MSWQLASFLILGAGLAAGFAWYERSRPPAQVVALVAALAALAIAGRIAFAAFPNVKPTTDIVIFAGYALGPAPGFAAGALAALVSNFWFGQGPWTPWQMAGWGLCGLLGAGFALGVRNAGRLSLAALCGFAAIPYGLLLNFSVMASAGGEFSVHRFLVYEARAVPFNVAHMLGNVAFALLAGPAMVRMLTRFRQRFQWRAPAVATAILCLLLAPALRPGVARASDAGRAANWLESEQNSDGGFGASPGDPSTAAMTGWAMLGLEAAGRNPYDVSRQGHTPLDFLRTAIGEVSSSGDLARTIVALEGAGADPRGFAGRNLVADLLDHRAVNGSFQGWPGTTSFSVIALRSAGAEGGLDKTLSWLAKVQNGDGGWGDVPESPSNADVTGLAMQAMPNTEAGDAGLAYLRAHQHSDGGFGLGDGGPVNAQSTALAVQGMTAIGADPAKVRSGGKSPLDYLASVQAGDGHYRYSAGSDQTPIWVTGQALVAVAGDAYPISAPPRKKSSGEGAGKTAKIGSPSTDEGGTATTVPSLPESSSGSGGNAGGVSPLAPTPAAPAAPGGAVPLPGQPEGGAAPLPGTAEAAPPSGVREGTLAMKSYSPSSGPPLAIGLLAAALALGLPWWLGRRYGW
jgi:energy-coupling factor transport system substrate-specific component